MDVYCFYTNTLYGMSPSLYAYSDDKSIAKEFRMIRKGLRQLIKNMDKDQFTHMKDQLYNLYLIPEEFVTKNTSGAITSTKMYATSTEIIEFREHIDAITTVMIGLSTVDPNIFTDEFREKLDMFGYTGCYQAVYDPGCVNNPFSPGFDLSALYTPKLWTGGKYVIDELEMFIRHHRTTFFNPTETD